MLNREQFEAVNSNADKILCLAGAGTGKTYSMIERISRLVDEEHVSPLNILVLTFTNAAAFEMEGRYKKNHNDMLTPTFGTFHSFCYKLILHNRNILEKLGYSQSPELITEEDNKLIDAEIKKTSGIKLSSKKLMCGGVLNRQEQYEYETYWKQYDKELRRRNLITFEIMCEEVCKLFTENDPEVEKYKELYSYIFVDEFQDTDPIQWKFIQSFKQSKLFVVGDVKQAIYSFRGADSSIIKSLAKSDEWHTVKLVQNYRSTVQICNFANNIDKNADPAYNIDLVSDKSGSDVITLKSCEVCQCKEMIDILVNNAKKSIQSGNTTAFLMRTNSEVNIVKDILKRYGINVNVKNTKDDNINVLKACMDDELAVSWLASKLPAERYDEFLKIRISKDNVISLNEFIDIFGHDWQVVNSIRNIAEVQSILNRIDLLPYQKAERISSFLKLPNAVGKIEDNSYEGILSYCIQVASYSEEDTMGLVGIKNVASEKEGSVYVGTIHSSKGLEYDDVILLGVGGKSFRITNEENRNLYYVGATRAKKNLFVYKSL